MAVDFYVDAISSHEVCGWAWLPDSPEMSLMIEIIDGDGFAVTQSSADMFRSDLADAGKRQGWCGFILAIPADFAAGDYRLRAREGAALFDLGPSFPLQPLPLPERAPEPIVSETVRTRDSAVLSGPDGAKGHIDRIGPLRITGWVHRGAPFGPVQHVELVADGEIAAQAAVTGWRNDIEDFLQGDGRVGFDIAIPAHLLDGEEHRFDLRWAGEGGSLLGEPIWARMGVAPAADAGAANGEEAQMSASAADGPVMLSIIVNFYNMHREAERTLASLSRRFQRDLGDLRYEVICIDNGSSPPMREADVRRHGPEFRLFRPSIPHPSPVFALNEAAAAAQGQYLALMIDGAHLLSPGVIAEAMAGLRGEPRAMIAIRHWFIGGDQRWLSAIGYRRDYEDLPFAKIGWPDCGYDIFKIGAPIFDSPNTWFDSLSESNCLFLSAADFAELGGYDQGFTMPGAGFANLDLFARAARLPGMAVVSLIGEASFHQYHGGTTTNVSDAEKESRVRRYASAFEAIRGHSYRPIHSSELIFRGRIRSDFALNARQRASGRVRLGLTGSIRPVPFARSFEQGARDFAGMAYVEGGGPQRTSWAGQPLCLAPADLIEIQQMLWSERPEILILKDVEPGLLAFVRSIMPSLRLEGMRLVWLTLDADGETPPGVIRLVGDLADDAIAWSLLESVGSIESVSLLFQPRPDEAMPLAALQRHATFVSVGGYLVVLGAGFGQPAIGYADRWTSNAIHRFLGQDRRFVIDGQFNAHLVTTCPSGFLRRLPEAAGATIHDDSLDNLTEFEIV